MESPMATPVIVKLSKLLLVTATTFVLFVGFAPAGADAAETVIGFDDQATGTTIGNQYAAQGVTFDVKPSGAAELHPTVVEPPAGEPHSAPKALDVSQKCGSEFAEAHMWARFAAPAGLRRHLRRKRRTDRRPSGQRHPAGL